MAISKQRAEGASRPNLREPRPGTRGSGSPLDQWLRAHPDALSVLEEWLELRSKGETPWALSHLVAELIARYGMPKVSDKTLRAWLQRNRAEQFTRGGAL